MNNKDKIEEYKKFMIEKPPPPKRLQLKIIYEGDSEAYLKNPRYCCPFCGSSLKKTFKGFLGMFFDTREIKCINEKCENYYGGENGQ